MCFGNFWSEKTKRNSLFRCISRCQSVICHLTMFRTSFLAVFVIRGKNKIRARPTLFYNTSWTPLLGDHLFDLHFQSLIQELAYHSWQTKELGAKSKTIKIIAIVIVWVWPNEITTKVLEYFLIGHWKAFFNDGLTK